ncbi:MAG: hypothetical protein K2X50_02020 [Gammaproteobacteria bacterium]|nr:hypothetical protein [Gammaproteobacteria bacterium]
MKNYPEMSVTQEKALIEATHYFGKLVTKAVVDPEQNKKSITLGNKLSAAGNVVKADGSPAGADEFARNVDGSIKGSDGKVYVSYENYQASRIALIEALTKRMNQGNVINVLRVNPIDPVIQGLGYVAVPPAAGGPQENYAATTKKAEIELGNGPNSNRVKINDQGSIIHNLVKGILNSNYAEKILPAAKEFISAKMGVNFQDSINLEKARVFALAADRAKDHYLLAFDDPAVIDLLINTPAGTLATSKNILRTYTRAPSLNAALSVPPDNANAANAVFSPRADEIADAIAEFVFNQLNMVNLAASEVIKNSLQGYVVKAEIKTIAGPISIDTTEIIPDLALDAAKNLLEQQPAATGVQARDAAVLASNELAAKVTAAINKPGSMDDDHLKLLRSRAEIALNTVGKMNVKLGDLPNISASNLIAAMVTSVNQIPAPVTPTDDQKLNYLNNLLQTVKSTADSKDVEKAKSTDMFSALKDLSDVLLKNYGKDVFSNDQLKSLQGNIDGLLDVLDKAAENSSNKKVPALLSALGLGISALAVQLGTQKDFTPASIAIIAVDVIAAIVTPLIAHYKVDVPQNQKTDQNKQLATQLKAQLSGEADTKAVQYNNSVASLIDKFKTKNTNSKTAERFTPFIEELAASKAAMAKGGV